MHLKTRIVPYREVERFDLRTIDLTRVFFQAMNVTSSKVLDCRLRLAVSKDERFYRRITLASFLINSLICPVVVLMNALAIAAVASRRRLRHGTRYNVLLACLAATDLLVGLVVQPVFIAAEVFVFMSDASSVDHCWIFDKIYFVLYAPCRASIYHLALLSAERYIAMRYSLRYYDVLTSRRLTAIVVLAWFVAVIPSVASDQVNRLIIVGSVSACLAVILFCHVAVYLVTRRHKARIKTEQLSADATASFLKEKKALITTSIIIGVAFLSYSPGVLYYVVRPSVPSTNAGRLVILLSPLAYCLVMTNSLYNPIIYCVTSREFRKAINDLLRRRGEAD